MTMASLKELSERPAGLKKFYFFEYFYILLACLERFGYTEKIFDEFNLLKQEFLLGESKYKKLSFEKESETRFRYTIEQVLLESSAYGLVEVRDSNVDITSKGRVLLDIFRQNDSFGFYTFIARLMEEKYNALHHLINFCYKANERKHGLLIFPTYSPPRLGIEKKEIVLNRHIDGYIDAVTSKIEKDIKEFLDEKINLKPQEEHLRHLLNQAGLIGADPSAKFNHNFYNATVRRVRNFWVNYFLKELYNYEFSLSTFDICTYRAKQIGVLHATEFFPKFDGKVIYPTSIIINGPASSDFDEIISYPNGERLFMHKPQIADQKNMEAFLKALTEAYLSIKSRTKTYFVNLLDTREIVCYNMKICESIFNDFLNDTYKLNLSNKLKIGIALESDKLPQETSAMYLKREPILIDGKYKNIIAIDISSRRA